MKKTRQFEIGVYQDTYLGVDFAYFEAARETIEGTGGTFLMQLEKPILIFDSGELGFVLGGRTSYIPAERTTRGGLLLQEPESDDDEFWINEGNVGLELLSRHKHLTLRMRSQFETQYWNSAVTDNQAFTGASVSFGVDW